MAISSSAMYKFFYIVVIVTTLVKRTKAQNCTCQDEVAECRISRYWTICTSSTSPPSSNFTTTVSTNTTTADDAGTEITTDLIRGTATANYSTPGTEPPITTVTSGCLMCGSCPENCKECFGPGAENCTKCSDQYMMSSYSHKKPIVCKPCNWKCYALCGDDSRAVDVCACMKNHSEECDSCTWNSTEYGSCKIKKAPGHIPIRPIIGATIGGIVVIALVVIIVVCIVRRKHQPPRPVVKDYGQQVPIQTIFAD